MQKSNKSIAGYHLLMILSSVDGEFAPEEGLKLQEYLAEEFPFKINLDDELDVIATLHADQWKDHFEFHAKCFFDDSTEEERKDFIKFAKSLIKADDKVSDQEHDYYVILKKIWNLN
ncbi:TerB family tellurite resistance protein [Kaistella sp. G5-32]|uniref:TerB family tellurite resistance protein n=1 Tax=Kaistella gelatinilytica TaxID=2787636 RepID=A0ABS0F9S5_9FLAO|nr:TerB family tellurite resistance protein [Kaistella gelatinilytica]MBF8456455.1 TerB family tellurite resistance protein [Kaistella gelatinilytica]